MRCAIILAAILPMLACATQAVDIVRPFPLVEGYIEHWADPGIVNLACHVEGEVWDDGFRRGWNDSYCGCVDKAAQTVWIARHINCDLERVRLHEACHIVTGSSPAARALCAKEFH